MKKLSLIILLLILGGSKAWAKVECRSYQNWPFAEVKTECQEYPEVQQEPNPLDAFADAFIQEAQRKDDREVQEKLTQIRLEGEEKLMQIRLDGEKERMQMRFEHEKKMMALQKELENANR